MSPPSAQPHLTPRLCFNETALRDFLRTSRSAIDDSITQNLNGLLTPSRSGFDPTSTAARQLLPPAASGRQLDRPTCAAFKSQVLFPSWQTRADVLDYCAGVATGPDPDDPERLLREVESARERERVVDERLDPYSARVLPRVARAEALKVLVGNERGVERIVRARTWAVVGERCGEGGGGSGEGWEEALERWRLERKG